MPFFSVVIPTCHRNDLLALCLDKLAPGAQTLSSEMYEVIVSDDGKISNAQELVQTKYPWAKWLAGPRKGPAANRNNGARAAHGEWLVFTDDDCLPDSQLLEHYHHFILANPNEKAFEGAIEHIGPTAYLNNQDFECPINIQGGCFWSANICVKKDLFQVIKGFDENYPHAALEDQDIYYRLLTNTAIPFVRNSIVLHPFKKVSYSKKIARIKSMAKDWSYHAVKHKELLGYKGKGDVLKDSVWFYTKDIIRQLLKKKYKMIAYELTYLFLGHVYLTYYLYSKNEDRFLL